MAREVGDDNICVNAVAPGLTMSDGVLEGVAESVDRSGALRLRHADGSFTRIVAGDVTLREQ